MSIAAGDMIVVDVIRWDAGWEFDCPTVVLRPVLAVFEDGRSCLEAAEQIAEDVCINDGALSTEPPDAWWRSPSLKRLKRAWARSRRGLPAFERYAAERFEVRFSNDEDGELDYHLSPLP